MNDNDSIDTYMNETLHTGYVSSIIGLLNSHIIPQDNSSSKLNAMNISVDNGDINGDSSYINGSTGSESNNPNSVDYTKKRDEISTNRYLMENNGLQDYVGIDVILPAPALNQYYNIEYNNEHQNLLINGNISTSNKSSVSTSTSPSITSTNEELC